MLKAKTVDYKCINGDMIFSNTRRKNYWFVVINDDAEQNSEILCKDINKLVNDIIIKVGEREYKDYKDIIHKNNGLIDEYEDIWFINKKDCNKVVKIVNYLLEKLSVALLLEDMGFIIESI
jgi:hypothetical protein